MPIWAFLTLFFFLFFSFVIKKSLFCEILLYVSEKLFLSADRTVLKSVNQILIRSLPTHILCVKCFYFEIFEVKNLEIAWKIIMTLKLFFLLMLCISNLPLFTKRIILYTILYVIFIIQLLCFERIYWINSFQKPPNTSTFFLIL